MMLSDEQVEWLFWEVDVDENTDADAFVESTERLLSRRMQKSTREPNKVVRNDVERIRKAIDKASDTTMGILALRGYPLDELKAHLDTFELSKLTSTRIGIGIEARAVLYNHNIDIGSLINGNLTRYIQCLFDALELNYDATDTARSAIAWWKKEIEEQH